MCPQKGEVLAASNDNDLSLNVFAYIISTEENEYDKDFNKSLCTPLPLDIRNWILKVKLVLFQGLEPCIELISFR